MRRLHRLNACALGLFLILHLGNHLTLAGGTGAHMAVQDALRPLCRWLPLEIALIALFAVQILLGLRLMLARGRPDTRWAWAQVISGLYIAVFLLIHLGAIAEARLNGVDTNVHFAGAGLHLPGLWLFFAPYYTLAVGAVFTHIAAALHFRGAPHMAGLAVAGFVLGSAIVAGLMGAFGGPLPPEPYLERLRF